MAQNNISEYLKSINLTKENLMDDEIDGATYEKGYVPYVINHCLYPFMDTIMIVNEVNLRPHMDKKLQYDFLLHSVRKRKRFEKWIKSEKTENLDLVKAYYGYNDKKAQEALMILNDDDIQHIKNKLETGGKRKGSTLK